jgi:hypothetical protein
VAADSLEHLTFSIGYLLFSFSLDPDFHRDKFQKKQKDQADSITQSVLG